jgi:hypothetical protein
MAYSGIVLKTRRRESKGHCKSSHSFWLHEKELYCEGKEEGQRSRVFIQRTMKQTSAQQHITTFDRFILISSPPSMTWVASRSNTQPIIPLFACLDRSWLLADWAFSLIVRRVVDLWKEERDGRTYSGSPEFCWSWETEECSWGAYLSCERRTCWKIARVLAGTKTIY